MRTGRTLALSVLFAAALGLAAPGPARAGDPPAGGRPAPVGKAEEAFRAKVREAIARGVAWVRKQQDPDGRIRGFYGETDQKDPELRRLTAGHRLGETALALHTLRSCGVPAGDPQVTSGFAFARACYQAQKTGEGLQTYDVSFAIIALDTHCRPAPPPPQDLAWIREMTARLVAAQEKPGAFGYGLLGEDACDLSNTQIALLALRSARRMGVDVPADLWKRALLHLLKAQEPSGPNCVRRDASWKPVEGGGTRTVAGRDRARGWGYREGAAATGSMTAGGVSSLALCRSELLGKPGYDGALDARAEQAIWDGIAWIGHQFDVSANPGPRDAPAPVQGKLYYWLYGLERAGSLTGVPWMGEHDWYREGAKRLLEHQAAAGHWSGGMVESCFALLFLQRATAPAQREAVSSGSHESIDLTGAESLDEGAFGDLVAAVFKRFAAEDAKGRKTRAAEFVRMGTRSIPHLIRRLRDEHQENRAAAADALLLTTGESQGYDAAMPADARAAASARWETWWRRTGAQLVADPNTGRFR